MRKQQNTNVTQPSLSLTELVRALVVAIPKPEIHWGTEGAIVLYICYVFPLKSSRDSSTLVSKQSSTHCSTGAGRLSTREVGRRPGHPADTGHRG